MSNTMEPPPKPRYQRLLIGFNHHMECRSVLNFAAQVAQVAEVELAGVFVEDQELLDLARLPFSTEILSASGAIRNIDSRRVESDLRGIALGMREALRKLAGHAQRRYSFRTVRGRLLHELIAQAGSNDLILLRTADFVWRNAKPGMAASSGPIVLLQPPASENGNLFNLARGIAHSMQQEIVIEENYERPEQVRRLNARLIIVSASMFHTGGDDISRFIEAAPCPVLIVPMTRAEPARPL
ncbi:MAG: hypothetical protein ABL951_02045 [Alphaproteobacteria bacterium]